MHFRCLHAMQLPVLIPHQRNCVTKWTQMKYEHVCQAMDGKVEYHISKTNLSEANCSCSLSKASSTHHQIILADKSTATTAHTAVERYEATWVQRASCADDISRHGRMYKSLQASSEIWRAFARPFMYENMPWLLMYYFWQSRVFRLKYAGFDQGMRMLPAATALPKCLCLFLSAYEMSHYLPKIRQIVRKIHRHTHKSKSSSATRNLRQRKMRLHTSQPKEVKKQVRLQHAVRHATGQAIKISPQISINVWFFGTLMWVQNTQNHKDIDYYGHQSQVGGLSQTQDERQKQERPQGHTTQGVSFNLKFCAIYENTATLFLHMALVWSRRLAYLSRNRCISRALSTADGPWGYIHLQYVSDIKTSTFGNTIWQHSCPF